MHVQNHLPDAVSELSVEFWPVCALLFCQSGTPRVASGFWNSVKNSDLRVPRATLFWRFRLPDSAEHSSSMLLSSLRVRVASVSASQACCCTCFELRRTRPGGPWDTSRPVPVGSSAHSESRIGHRRATDTHVCKTNNLSTKPFRKMEHIVQTTST